MQFTILYSVHGCFYATIQSICLSKTVSETKCYLSTTIERPTYLSTLTSAQRTTISIFLYFFILSIMIEMQKLKFMQEFSFAISVACLHSSMQEKLLMHNYARAKQAKHVL